MDTTTEKLNGPLVTILMLTYNRAQFLPTAIDSVLKQTHTNWKLVILDDGSTDNTKDLIATYSDPRILYIQHEHNSGLFARRAESLSYATSTYTAVLDSDDYWTTATKLAEQVAFLENYSDHVVVGTHATLINEQGTSFGNHTVLNNDEAIRNKILARNQFIHSSLLIRTEALNKTTGYQPTLAEDLELVLQLGTFGKFANLPHAHTAHRVHRGSQNDRGRKMAQAVDKIVATYKTKYPHAWYGLLFSKLRLLRSYF